MDEPIVIGIDAGGTNVRALACTATGTRLGTGTAAGANPTSRGSSGAAEQIHAALAEALSTVESVRVRNAVIGAAGSLAHGPELAEALEKVWAQLQVECPRSLRSDLEVAFAAGRPEENGMIVLAGTGAAVAEVRDSRVNRVLDGAGWLVGDIGSGFWLGREAVRSALAQFDGTGEPTSLTALVCGALTVPEQKWPLVRAVYAREPLRLAELAPLVAMAAADGDQIAAQIIDRAAATLIGQAETLLQGATDLTAGVLAGGVLLAGGELAERVGMSLTTDHALAVGLATDGAAGAAWLALRELDPAVPAAVHGLLTGP